MVIFWFLHRVVVKYPDSTKELNAFACRVSELVLKCYGGTFEEAPHTSFFFSKTK
jgi:hypothetical protein